MTMMIAGLSFSYVHLRIIETIIPNSYQYAWMFWDLGPSKDGNRWDSEGDHLSEVKELGRSKWSNDPDDDNEKIVGVKTSVSALSGLIQAYGKKVKSVRWADQVFYSYILLLCPF